MPSAIAFLLAVFWVVHGNMGALLYIPLSAIMLAPYFYNAGKFKVSNGCIDAVILLTTVCNGITFVITFAYFELDNYRKQRPNDTLGLVSFSFIFIHRFIA